MTLLLLVAMLVVVLVVADNMTIVCVCTHMRAPSRTFALGARARECRSSAVRVAVAAQFIDHVRHRGGFVYGHTGARMHAHASLIEDRLKQIY